MLNNQCLRYYIRVSVFIFALGSTKGQQATNRVGLLANFNVYIPSGDLGPVYGFQWRHFDAEYVDMHTDYSGEGVDQLAQVIHIIKINPNDRRIIMSAWNPVDKGSFWSV